MTAIYVKALIIAIIKLVFITGGLTALTIFIFKDGKRKGKPHRRLSRLLVVCTIISAFANIPGVVKSGSNLTSLKGTVNPNSLSAPAESEIYAKEEKEESDIKGMTVADKRKMGLDAADGSDTDGDGITDKDEIEKYHTDPLMASTSNDMYSDGYKLTHNMDFNKKYSGNSNKEKIENNESSELKPVLTSLNQFGRDTEMMDISGTDTLDGRAVYREYYIDNYRGKLNIDIKKLLKNADIRTKDITVYVMAVPNTENAAIRVKPADSDKNSIMIDTADIVALKNGKKTVDYPFTGYIFLTKKTLSNPSTVAFNIEQGINGISPTEKAGSIVSIINGKKITYYTEDQDDPADGIIYGSPFLGLFTKTFSIRYAKLRDETRQKKEYDCLWRLANHTVAGGMFTNENSIVLNKKKSNIEASDRTEITAKYKMLKKFLPHLEGVTLPGKEEKGTIWDVFKVFFCYARYDDVIASVYGDKDKKGTDSHGTLTGFDPRTDEFLFGNFAVSENDLPDSLKGKDIASNGYCAGLSWMSAKLDNDGTLAEKGSRKSDNGAVLSYNIKGEKDNKTLTDRKLNDFKSKDFITNRSHTVKENNESHTCLDYNKLTKSEKDFIKILAVYHNKWNDAYLKNSRVFYWNTYNKLWLDRDGTIAPSNEMKYVYSYDTIKNMIHQLDKGKAVTVAMFNSSGAEKDGCHVLTIYGYKKELWTRKNPDGSKGAAKVIDFYVYDSNIPNAENAWTNYLRVFPKKEYNSFAYQYYDYRLGTDYVYSNNVILKQENGNIKYEPIKNQRQKFMFYVCDTNLNSLTVTKKGTEQITGVSYRGRISYIGDKSKLTNGMVLDKKDFRVFVSKTYRYNDDSSKNTAFQETNSYSFDTATVTNSQIAVTIKYGSSTIKGSINISSLLKGAKPQS